MRHKFVGIGGRQIVAIHLSQEAIPGSELWIVPDGDHVLIYGGRTPKFLRVTQRFLADREVEAPR